MPLRCVPTVAIPVYYAVCGIHFIARPALRLLVAIPFHGKVYAIGRGGMNEDKIVAVGLDVWELKASIIRILLLGLAFSFVPVSVSVPELSFCFGRLSLSEHEAKREASTRSIHAVDFQRFFMANVLLGDGY